MSNQKNQSNQSNQNNTDKDISIENLKTEIETIQSDIEKLKTELDSKIELYKKLKLKALQKRFQSLSQVTDIDSLKELQSEIQEIIGNKSKSKSKKEVPKADFLNYLKELKKQGIKEISKTKLYEDFKEYSIRNKLYSFHDFYPDKPSQKDTEVYPVNEFLTALNSSKKKPVLI